MDKPNILLITTDQQRFDTIHALGNAHIYTPHLNWLVDEGVTFRRCYSDSPICMPARATVMTGRHGYTHGLTTNEENTRPMEKYPTLPRALTRNGYQTRAQGKMHFYPIRANYGFEHMELPMDYYRYMSANTWLGTPKSHGLGENEIEPVISTVDEVHSSTHWTVRRSIDFLETRDETRPFFLWTSFAKPHPPFDPCFHHWMLYQNKILPPPVYGDWSKDICESLQGYYQPTYTLNNAYRMSEGQLLDVKRAYYACITQIDYSLGLLFARLREMGLLENTWIFFTSDHGDMMGDHHMCAKSVFLEGSAHVPMIIRPPDAREHALNGKRCDTMVTLADIMPTILKIAGVKEQIETDGTDMLDLVDIHTEDRVFYGNSSNNFLAIMAGGYKYSWCCNGGEELLFNINEDPMERNNLAQIEYETAAHLKRMLTEQSGSYNGGLVQNGELIVKDAIKCADAVPKFPGFYSTSFPSDVLH